MILISSYSPPLEEAKKYNFHPYCLTWQAKGVQNVTEIDGIFVRVKHDKFLRTVSHDAILIFVVFMSYQTFTYYIVYLFTYYIVTMTTIILYYEQIKYSIVTLAECYHLSI